MEEKRNRYQSFVTYALQRCQNDTGYAAKLRKADNPDTASQAWDLLLNYGIDITREHDLRAFALIGAALSRSKANADGPKNLGGALKACLGKDEKPEESSIALRLRRILACSSQEELCLVLRPLLNLIAAKSESKNPLCFAQLLKEIHWFGYDEEETQRIKLRWAQDFYAPERKAE